MKLDRKAIETLSVNAVKNSIVTSDYLDQFIAENDKEPSWDGFVYVYSEKSKKKDKLKGRVAVQVKGHQESDFSKAEISYSMDIADLKNYLYDGGAMLFVVYVTDTCLTKIYYVELTPVRLRTLLDSAQGQKSKTVTLKEFPQDGNRKATIFLNCLQNCQKQASFVFIELRSLEDLRQSGLLEAITIPVTGTDMSDPMKALFTQDVYIYATIKGTDTPFPVKDIPLDIHTKEIIQKNVEVAGTVFYNEYSLIRSANGMTYCFGDSVTITLDEKTHRSKINYKQSDSLRKFVTDADFFLQFINNHGFAINGELIPLSISETERNTFDFEAHKGKLEFAQRAAKALDLLNYRGDLHFSTLSPEDFRNLERLINAFVDKQPISGVREGIPPVANLEVGKLKFTLLFKPVLGKRGTYELFDFFKSELSVAYDGKNGEKIPTSQYDIFEDTDLIEISNIRTEVLLPSFLQLDSPEKYTRANFFLLRLLKAYDLSNDERHDLLATAEEFAIWLKSIPKDDFDRSIANLNYCQTMKRKRSLYITEVNDLWKLAEDNSQEPQIRLAAYILLGQPIPAQKYYDMLSASEQKEFMSYPIVRYWKKLEDC